MVCFCNSECFLKAILIVNLGAIIFFFSTSRIVEQEKYSNNADDTNQSFETITKKPEKETILPRFLHNLGDWVDLEPIEDINPDSLMFIENSEKNEVSSLAICCLESAALHNPDKSIYFIRTAKALTAWNRDLNEVANAYENVYVNSIDPDKLVLETPVASLWYSERITKSRWMVSHLSDVLRVAALYKFGGTYIDTDVITISTHPADKNFVNFEEPGSINGAIMKFEKEHPVIDAIGSRLAKHFNPRKFAANGPRLLSVALAAECGLDPVQFAKATSLGPGGKCKDLRSFGPEMVFAVHYKNWKWFFQPSQSYKVETLLNSSFATHIWGHFFGQEIQWDRLNSGQAFQNLAKRNCPKVFESFALKKY